jgi:metal-responsive CopG/Arc/MetJ family transcriptional regulator
MSLSNPRPSEPARITVNLPARLWTELEETANTDQISKTEALRRAVWVYLLLRKRLDEGAEVLLTRPDGVQERLLLPY